MAIDQYDVSSKLRFMEDRALQQYAAMHKNDPYIFPLAFQESQNRQRLRMQQQAQAGAQPQPKVADQALAQMAPPQPQPMPEDQGIATLPAPNMKFAAEGGIMGYEGYGEEPQQFGQEPVLRMAGGGVARYQVGGSIESKYRQESQEMGMGTRIQYSPDVQEYARLQAQPSPEEQQAFKDEQQRMLSGGRFNAFPPLPGADAKSKQSTPTATPPADYDPAQNLKKLAKTDKYTTYSAPKNAEEAALLSRYPAEKRAPAEERVAAPRADTERAAPTRAATASSAKTETGGLDSLIQNFTRQTDLAMGANKNARVGQAALLEKEATEESEATKKRIKEEGDVFKGKEERLAAREKGIEGMGDKYMGLALLQAGAAMMSTPGNLGSVIGKGIQVGSERYVAGIDKINAAKEKFAEARDRLDDLRLNRDDMNKKEIRDADRAIRTARIQGQQLLVDGAGKDLEISTKNQTAIFGAAADNLKTDKELASREKIASMQERGANARSATPDKLVFDQLTRQYGGDTVKAAEALQKMKTEKFNVYDAYSRYLQAFAGKENLMKGPDDFDVFAKRFIPTVTPGKNTTVRTQPGG